MSHFDGAASEECAGLAPRGAPPPLAGLRFSLLGPGRVGSSLARWAEGAGARLVGIAAREPGSPPWEGAPPRLGLDGFSSAGQDLLLLAVPDGALSGLATALSATPQAAVVLHTAGSLGASVLAPLREGGSSVGSLHPLKAFPRPLPDLADARGTLFAIDGDAAACDLASRLARAWGGVSALVPEDARTLYHFAATLAAGGVVTLLASAIEIASRLGLPGSVAGGLAELSRGAVAQAIETLEAGRPAPAAITGPAARGDRETVSRQLDALRRAIPDKVPLVLDLLRETLRQVGSVRPGDSDVAQLLEEVDRVIE